MEKTYCIREYKGERIIMSGIKNFDDAIKFKDELLKEKSKYSKDYTDYNWLLLVDVEQYETK